MTDEELNMTYFLKRPHLEVEDGSDRGKKLTEQHKKGGKMLVGKSIEAIQGMVLVGTL